MPKFIIEYDPSRFNSNNELLPLNQFIAGPISLKNTNKVYTLFIGETNKDSLVDNLSSFKDNISIYRKLAVSLPLDRKNIIIGKLPVNINSSVSTPSGNNITGNKNPYVFIDQINNLIPHPNKSLAKDLRKKAISNMPNTVLTPEIKLDSLLKRDISQNEKNILENKINNLIDKQETKISSLPLLPIKVNIKRK